MRDTLRFLLLTTVAAAPELFPSPCAPALQLPVASSAPPAPPSSSSVPRGAADHAPAPPSSSSLPPVFGALVPPSSSSLPLPTLEVRFGGRRRRTEGSECRRCCCSPRDATREKENQSLETSGTFRGRATEKTRKGFNILLNLLLQKHLVMSPGYVPLLHCSVN